jgi:murein DD-endopeptidase MepM/ murein hydrolase activator NlpD
MAARNETVRNTARRLAVGLALCCALFGCTALDQKFGQDDWYKKAKVDGSQAADATGKAAVQVGQAAKVVAADAYKRMQKYAAEKDLLKTFTDAGEHSESVVLNILHGNQSKAVPPASGNKGKDGKGTPPPAVANIPEAPDQYKGSLRWPVDACVISSKFGARWGKIHKGMDLAADTGEPVYAIADGTVIYAGDGLRGYGNVVILRHDKKLTSLYAHNSALKVKQGDTVVQGQLISLLGSTGHSTGPHVHFEIREGDVALDPSLRLPKAKFIDASAPAASKPAKGGDS